MAELFTITGRRHGETVMGLPVTVDVRGGDVEPGAVERAFAWLRRADALFSPYRVHSQISRIAAGTLAARNADPLVREVLDRCEALGTATGGAFDARAGGRLDPSGLVKGWAVERAAALLHAAGATDFCIDAGGDVALRGEPAPGRAWRVGIRHPHRPGRLAAALALRGPAAVATSATYERGAHIVDPHTGRPPRGAVSVTVLGRDLATTDAYATAAFALGEDGPAWTLGLPGHGALSILDGDRVLTTPLLERHRIPLATRE